MLGYNLIGTEHLVLGLVHESASCMRRRAWLPRSWPRTGSRSGLPAGRCRPGSAGSADPRARSEVRLPSPPTPRGCSTSRFARACSSDTTTSGRSTSSSGRHRGRLCRRPSAGRHGTEPGEAPPAGRFPRRGSRRDARRTRSGATSRDHLAGRRRHQGRPAAGRSGPGWHPPPASRPPCPAGFRRRQCVGRVWRDRSRGPTVGRRLWRGGHNRRAAGNRGRAHHRGLGSRGPVGSRRSGGIGSLDRGRSARTRPSAARQPSAPHRRTLSPAPRRNLPRRYSTRSRTGHVSVAGHEESPWVLGALGKADAP